MFSVVYSGVLPVTEFLKSSGIDISERGFIVVDKASPFPYFFIMSSSKQQNIP